MIPTYAPLVRAAVHEAGHAIVAMSFGVTPRSVSIIPDHERSGHCDVQGMEFPNPIAGLAVPFGGQAAVARAWPDHEALFLPGQAEFATDLELADVYARRFWEGADVVEALGAAGDVATQLVDQHWPHVEALARRLLAEGIVITG